MIIMTNTFLNNTIIINGGSAWGLLVEQIGIVNHIGIGDGATGVPQCIIQDIVLQLKGSSGSWNMWCTSSIALSTSYPSSGRGSCFSAARYARLLGSSGARYRSDVSDELKGCGVGGPVGCVSIGGG